MPKVITFQTPVLEKKSKEIVTEERQGFVALLYVGNVQEKFVLQFERKSTEVECLTHFASGQKVGSLNPIKVRNFRSYSRMTDRAAAEELIKDIIARHGADTVRAKLNAAPILNT